MELVIEDGWALWPAVQRIRKVVSGMSKSLTLEAGGETLHIFRMNEVAYCEQAIHCRVITPGKIVIGDPGIFEYFQGRVKMRLEKTTLLIEHEQDEVRLATSTALDVRPEPQGNFLPIPEHLKKILWVADVRVFDYMWLFDNRAACHQSSFAISFIKSEARIVPDGQPDVCLDSSFLKLLGPDAEMMFDEEKVWFREGSEKFYCCTIAREVNPLRGYLEIVEGFIAEEDRLIISLTLSRAEFLRALRLVETISYFDGVCRAFLHFENGSLRIEAANNEVAGGETRLEARGQGKMAEEIIDPALFLRAATAVPAERIKLRRVRSENVPPIWVIDSDVEDGEEVVDVVTCLAATGNPRKEVDTQ